MEQSQGDNPRTVKLSDTSTHPFYIVAICSSGDKAPPPGLRADPVHACTTIHD